ncbi:haloacid dehalogenase, partial [Burkholderia pseudomallei]
MTALTLLFDLDGTLVDTDALHLNAYNALLARWNRSIDLDYYKTHVMGFSDDLIFGRLFPGMPAAEYTELAAEKERTFRAQLGAKLTPTAGTADLLGYAERVGAKTAVVTNAPRENATMMLNALGLADRFGTLVIGGELEHGKPHPLPYLTA